MRNYIFVYRLADSDDRDICAYIDTNYSHHVGIHGACYAGGRIANYEDVQTVLSRKDFETLFSDDVSLNDFNRIVKKLTNDKGTKFFEDIKKSEIEYLKNKYNLSDNDIETIFNEYSLDYRDRAIVGYVFDNTESYGENEFWELGYESSIPEQFKDCIDYQKVGEKFIEWEDCVELEDGRIVTLMY